MSRRSRDFIPALSFHALTRFYDPLIRWAMREDLLKGTLLDHARIAAGMRVLDVGCGTGTLTVMAKRAHPTATVVGLDPDGRALTVAREKAAGLDIDWQQATAQAIPYADHAFDRVLASLMLHHLDRPAKRAALREMHRVLSVDGRLVVLDFTAPDTTWARLVGRVLGHLEHADDNIAGLLPSLIQDAGFPMPREVARFATVFGQVSILTTTRP